MPPLVMPEIITGLSLLLLFVALVQATGWPDGRGFWTITIAHTTLTLAFVAVIVESRLDQFDRRSRKRPRSWLPAAQGLFDVTLPLICAGLRRRLDPGLSLSLDDLVIASFTTGPGATTLPIRISSEVRLGVKPEINAVCTIMIAVVALGTVTASLIAKRGAARRDVRHWAHRFNP